MTFGLVTNDKSTLLCGCLIYCIPRWYYDSLINTYFSPFWTPNPYASILQHADIQYLTTRWHSISVPKKLNCALTLCKTNMVYSIAIELCLPNINLSMPIIHCSFPGERPYKCTACDKAFNQKGALQVHMTRHTGERPHMCDFCPSTFSQKGNLRAHIQVQQLILFSFIGDFKFYLSFLTTR